MGGAIAVPPAYASALVRAGATPVLLQPGGTDAARRLAGEADGLLLPGGGDVASALYGQKPHPEADGCEPGRDKAELAALETALARGLPVLAICRGMQLLNAALGGTLHQHLPDLALRPRIDHRADAARHAVRTAPGSLARRVLRRGKIAVNSTHHQAVDRVAKGLVPAAWAEDNVVEAVEAADGRPILGVQFHPERLVDETPAFLRLFRWLAAEALSLRRARGSGGDGAP